MEPAGLTAIYSSRDAAERAAVRLREAGFPPEAVHVGDPRMEAESARAETRVDAETTERGLLMTNVSLWRGAIAGTVVGLAVGSLIFGVTMLVTDEPPAGTIGFLIAALVGGGTAGSVAGALIGAYWSFIGRRVTEARHVHDDVVLHVAAQRPERLEVAAELLQGTGARFLEEDDPRRGASPRSA